MRLLPILVSLLIVTTLHAQESKKSFKKENKIIKRGPCEYGDRNCLKKTTRYIDACKKIGDFYFNNQEYQKTLEYYQLVTELHLDGHGQVYMEDLKKEGLNNYKAIIERLGDMYYSGNIKTEDKLEKVMDFYNIKPSPFSGKEKEDFSVKMFGHIFYSKKLDSLSSDSVSAFLINPFFFEDKNISGEIIDEIKKTDTKLSGDSTLIASLLFYPIQTNEYEMGAIYRIQKFLLESTNKSNSQRWDVDEFGSGLIKLKNIYCYVLTIKISKRQ